MSNQREYFSLTYLHTNFMALISYTPQTIEMSGLEWVAPSRERLLAPAGSRNPTRGAVEAIHSAKGSTEQKKNTGNATIGRGARCPDRTCPIPKDALWKGPRGRPLFLTAWAAAQR